MTLVGFPDFQEQAQWQSPPAVEYSATLANGATKTFPETGPTLFNVSNWQNVQMRVFGTVGSLDVECQWYDASTPTALLGHSYFTTADNGSDTLVTLPNAGPYFRVNITNSRGFNVTLVAVIAFSNRNQRAFIPPSSGPMAQIIALNVAGGGGAVADATYLYAGVATLACDNNGTEPWLMAVRALTSNRAFTDIAYAGTRSGSLTDDTRTIILPPRAIQLNLFNLGAAAHTFNVILTPDMFR